jgi:IS30 family transposase
MSAKGHLTIQDREKIYLYLNLGLSKRKIATKLGRNHSVILREINHNQDDAGNYLPHQAQEKAETRKSESSKANAGKDERIWNYVKDKLVEGWSPEQISNCMWRDIAEYACIETIYNYIYSRENRDLTLWVHLRRGRKKRTRKRGRRTRKEKLKNRVFLESRPLEADERNMAGHWETDLMEGKRETKDCVSVTVDRKTRYVLLSKSANKTAVEKKKTLLDQLSHFLPTFKRSITCDNGLEQALHEEIAAELKLDIFFCHPYHSWEKGTVENTIGLIREYLPKKTSLENITQRHLNLIANRLNNRPRKCLGFKTPKQAILKELRTGAFRS